MNWFRKMLRILFWLLLICIAIGRPEPILAVDKIPTSRPNIVLIMADDLGHEVLNCYGGTSYKTPQIDALAKSGIRFANAYCTPLCSPSRVELMTGRYGFRTGWTQLIGRGEDESAGEYFDPKKEKTFGHLLRDAGYKTAVAGKWQLCKFFEHPNHAAECGFDQHCLWTWMLNNEKPSRYWDPSIWQNGKRLEGTAGKYGEDLYCDFLIDFIRQNKTGPFFAYYPMALVHQPFEMPPGEDGKRLSQAGGKKKKAQGPPVFTHMVAYMDRTVGRLVKTLDELGIRENTIVIFTGDNGTPQTVTSQMGNITIRGGKGTVTNMGTHAPFIVSWPGTTPAGKVLEDLIDFSDVVPTLCELTGAKLPEGVIIDGHSFAPQLRGEQGQPREWIFSQLGKRRMVRDARYLLHDDGRIYDVVVDPLEKTNLAGASSEADAAAKKLRPVLDQLK